MSRTYTPQEVQARYEEAMGRALGRLFYELFNECCALHIEWAEYVRLFGGENRVAVLNQTAPAFFRLIQDSLFEHVLLHIARLTDPPQVAGRETLTLRRLPAMVSREHHEAIARCVSSLLVTVAFARDWRNRRMAHRDLLLVLDEPATPLVEATRLGVQQAIDAISTVLGLVEAAYCHDSPTRYDFVTSGPGDVEALMWFVEHGLEERRRRFGR